MLLVLAVSAAWAAEDSVATEQVQLKLIASTSTVSAGETVTLGIEQRIAAGWHTYWKNPGDAGLATRVDWHLPEGSVAGALQWPAPTKFGDGDVINYGYADHAVLLSQIRVPSHLKAGDSFAVRAQVKWLACRETCIPQQGELALELPVGTVRNSGEPERPEIVAARAQLPQPKSVQARLESAGGGVRLALALPDASAAVPVSQAWFYPDRPGQVIRGGGQAFIQDGSRLSMSLGPGSEAPRANDASSGVLVVQYGRGPATVRKAYLVDARPAGTEPATSGAQKSPSVELALALVLSFVGGALLNLMPCVFPVLSIKALALLKYAVASRCVVRRQGYIYTLGVQTSFLVLGCLLLATKAAGGHIGWGLQFQSPGFVLALTYLFFSVGLNLSGVVQIGGAAAGIGESLTARAGYLGSFFSGALAATVAMPCTAPMMGAAIGYALAQPALTLFAVLQCLGLGLSMPYLLLTHWPALQARLPRPGAWMEVLRQLLAFPMYGGAVWLLWVLGRQAGPGAVAAALVGLVLIAFAAWLFRQSRTGIQQWRNAAGFVSCLIVAAAALTGYGALERLPSDPGGVAANEESIATPYTRQTLETLRASGQPVLLNLTAAWCISCLVNEQVALGRPEVRAVRSEQRIAYLKGDWTNQDADVSDELARFGRSGVPLYVFYPKGVDSNPVVLPQILTPGMLIETLRGGAS